MISKWPIVFLIVMSITFQSSYATPKSCNCVAFRLDDIQDYWLDDVQISILDTFQKKNTPLTIGIIGNYFGDDTKMVKYLQEKLTKKEPRIEIANHGWNHEDFTKLTKSEQSALMGKTNQKITKLLGVKPSIFIPPFNTVNNEMLLAMQQNGMRYLSANMTQDVPSALGKNTIILHLPAGAKTGDFSFKDASWKSENHKQTLIEVFGSLQKYGYAIVAIHPQEYAVRSGFNYKNEIDKNQIRELQLLIDQLRAAGLRIIPLGEIANNVGNSVIPVWLTNVFSWHKQGKISDDELVSCVKYAIEKKILRFNLA